MSVPGPEANLVEHIRALVERELERRGRREPLRVEGAWLMVGRGASAARADVGGTLAQWEHLPEDLRDKRIVQIAGLLSSEPAAAALPRRVASRSRPGWASGFAPLLIVGITAAALVLAYRTLAPGSTGLGGLRGVLAEAPRATAQSPIDPDHERAALASAACDQSRARFARGSNVGPADVEGWVVELVLFTREAHSTPLSASPALAPFIRKKPDSSASAVVWPGARSLREAKRFDAQVEVRAYPALAGQNLNGASFVFSGPYVTPYFSEAERADYVMLADALSDALHATDGALFAHCIDSPAHYLGAWFLGVNPGAAIASVVYFMAAESEAPVLRPEILGADLSDSAARASHAFGAISTAATGLDRSAAATLVGTELGMVAGRLNQPVRLTFPFKDANRAMRASLAAARALKLSNSG